MSETRGGRSSELWVSTPNTPSLESLAKEEDDNDHEAMSKQVVVLDNDDDVGAGSSSAAATVAFTPPALDQGASLVAGSSAPSIGASARGGVLGAERDFACENTQQPEASIGAGEVPVGSESIMAMRPVAEDEPVVAAVIGAVGENLEAAASHVGEPC